MTHQMALILIVVLVLALVYGGNQYNGGVYRNAGYGLGGVLVLLLVLLVVTGQLHV